MLFAALSKYFSKESIMFYIRINGSILSHNEA